MKRISLLTLVFITINSFFALAECDLTMPIVPDTVITVCYGEAFPEISAMADGDIRWYVDGSLECTGKYFQSDIAFSDESVQIQCSQALDQCESEKETINYQIVQLEVPIINEFTTVCYGSTNVILEASGNEGDVIWYDDIDCKTPICTGDSYAYTAATSGTFTFFLTSKFKGCESNSATLYVHVLDEVEKPIINAPDTSILGQELVLEIEAGSDGSIKWFSDNGFLYSGLIINETDLNPEITEEGIYGFWAMRYSASGCQSSLVYHEVVVLDPEVTIAKYELHDNYLNTNFEIYPLPCTDLLNVKSATSEEFSLSIYNWHGCEILKYR